METNEDTIERLRSQDQELREQIAQLELTVEASSTPGIREYRRTRVQQLSDQRDLLSDRLRRLEISEVPPIDAHLLSTALRDATIVAQGTFRA